MMLTTVILLPAILARWSSLLQNSSQSLEMAAAGCSASGVFRPSSSINPSSRVLRPDKRRFFLCVAALWRKTIQIVEECAQSLACGV